MAKPEIKAIITDLDNTCWDWMGFFIPAMKRFVDKTAEIIGTTPEALYPEVRSVAQRHGSSEYGWILQELPSVQRHKEQQQDPRPIPEIFKPAIEAYCEERDKHLVPYAGVTDFFNQLGQRGTLRLAATDSLAFYTFTRLRKTGLDSHIDVAYVPPDNDMPPGADLAASRSHPPAYYKSRHTQYRALPPGMKKPYPEMLKAIMAEHKVKPHEVLVLGDHLWKDVWMAQQVGAHHAHALYGDYSNNPDYGTFMPKVSYFKEGEFEQERADKAAAGKLASAVVLQQGPLELFEHFNFVQGPQRARLPRGSAPVIRPTPKAA